MNQLPDWMYHAIEESFTCQFASTTVRAIPVALPVFLNHFDPDTGTLIISSPVAVKRVESARLHSYRPIQPNDLPIEHLVLNNMFRQCRVLIGATQSRWKRHLLTQ